MTLSPQLSLGLELSAQCTFDNFEPGDNQELLKLLKTFAACQGERYVYIWGSQGSGRSHLLQAVCQQAIEGQRSAIYVDMAASSVYSESLLENLESLSLVCIDNIHTIAGQDNWERALFVLYDAVMSNGGRLLISGDQHPTKLGIALSDLVSRLCWGQCLKLAPLEEQDLKRVMQTRAIASGLELPDEVSEFILKRVRRDMRSISHILHTLDRASLVEQRKLTVPFVKQVLTL